jgi:hypothetical protein
MSALTDALAKIQQVHDNEQALADPVAMAWQAQMAFYQALVDALELPAPTQAGGDAMAALQAENQALQLKVAAGESAIAAFESALHPQASTDAAPSSTEPPAIAPTNAGV